MKIVLPKVLNERHNSMYTEIFIFKKTDTVRTLLLIVLIVFVLIYNFLFSIIFKSL